MKEKQKQRIYREIDEFVYKKNMGQILQEFTRRRELRDAFSYIHTWRVTAPKHVGRHISRRGRLNRYRNLLWLRMERELILNEEEKNERLS